MRCTPHESVASLKMVFGGKNDRYHTAVGEPTLEHPRISSQWLTSFHSLTRDRNRLQRNISHYIKGYSEYIAGVRCGNEADHPASVRRRLS